MRKDWEAGHVRSWGWVGLGWGRDGMGWEGKGAWKEGIRAERCVHVCVWMDG